MTNSHESIKHPFTLDFTNAFLIRAFDLSAAALGLLALSPLFGIIALAVKTTSAGSIFYKADRVGQGGRLFKLYKFRTMFIDADKKGPKITLRNDSRITPVGRILRTYKLDELPQLINVLRGEMSLVGPRPEDPRYVALYTPAQRQVLNVRPGITSRASVYYREEEALLAGDNWETIYKEQILPRKLAAELTYLQQRTLGTDFLLILKTVLAIIHRGRRVSGLLDFRNRHFFLLDVILLLIIPLVALGLRLESFNWPLHTHQALILFTLVSLLVKLPVFYAAGLYKRYWRYAGVNELVQVLIGTGASTAILLALFVILHGWLSQFGLAMYRTVPLIDGLLTCMAVGGLRLGFRALHHWNRESQQTVGGRRVLVVGAGEAGSMIVREMRANPQLDKEAVAFVDDDPKKMGAHILDLPVLGTSADIPNLVAAYQIQQVIIAMPSASFRKKEQIKAICHRIGAAVYTVPGMYELLAGSKTINQIPTIDINQLLRRRPVEIDQAEVAAYLTGKRVLVTGAGGSIGSEICRQIARFEPQDLIVLGHGENSIFEISLDLRFSFPAVSLHQVIADIRDRDRVERIIEQHRPDVIFHAAAHKHVHLMENNVEEAFTNNVLGTHNLLQAAEKYGIERFILISTDKAVHPTSIMGATKRLAELLVVSAARRSQQTYLAVRFGNVLGSRGSVIPVFQRQIAAGGPVTVTHPEMCRYFMTIPEAVQLVLQATVLGQQGKVFMLDMGDPVRILDLAADLIRLSGLEPDRDIQIVYTGMRPGEKLAEELFLNGEDYRPTGHPKIFMAVHENNITNETIDQLLSDLVERAGTLQTPADVQNLHTLLLETCCRIDCYRPQPVPNRSPETTPDAPPGPPYPQALMRLS